MVSGGWVSIKNKDLILAILQSYADTDKKKILSITKTPRTILQIVNICKLPQTSTYRKMKSLIQHGLLVPFGTVSAKQGKIVTRYVSLFENLEINILKNNISIRAKISEDSTQAVARLIRSKIVDLNQERRSKTPKVSTIKKVPKVGSASLIPYLIRERAIEV